jgi:hypothetical protein
MTRLIQKQRFIIFGLILGIVLGFIFDNTLAIPLITRIKDIFGLEEIHTYITTIFINALSIALGIFLGLYVDKWKAYNDLMDDLEKILPLVEFEIRANYITLQKKPPAILKRTDFMMDYWEIYKNNVAKWEPINIIIVTEIYGLLNKWKQNYDMKSRIMQNSVQAIETWVDWYNGDLKGKPSKNALCMRNVVIEQLNKLDFLEYKKMAIKDMRELKKYPFNPMP